MDVKWSSFHVGSLIPRPMQRKCADQLLRRRSTWDCLPNWPCKQDKEGGGGSGASQLSLFYCPTKQQSEVHFT